MIDMGSTESLAQAFAVWAVSHPRRPALCPDGGKTRNYEELAAEAWAVADALRRLGIVGESRIAVLGGRTAETVVAILGVLIAGAAYCPIDPKLPAARRRQILDELKPAAMVVADPDLLLPADMACPVLPLTDCTPVPAARSFVLRPEASALAYVLFTSGSTGRPRGVMVENGSVCNMLRSYERIAPATDGCLGALIAPTAFDVSVWEIFSALAYGGTLYVPSEDRLAGGDELWDYLAENGIQSAYIPPGLLAPLLSAAERKQGALHRVLVGVEPIPQHVLQRLCAACPGLRIVNGYGPTETTITATLHLFRDVNDPHRRVPIGRPVAGSRVEIVDGLLAPVPLGAVGELVVYGDCLARGYLNSTVGGFVNVAGVRAYRTGDFGRLLPDGEIEFIGRGDYQLKVNGFRVELGEVEAALNSTPGVLRSVVLPVGELGALRLVAAVEAPANILAADVRNHVRERLPSYSVPSRIMVLQAFPHTANGKVDAQALLAADRSRPIGAADFAEPRTQWQRQVAEAWSAILGVPEVGIDDDFHELGGSSLDAVRVAMYLGNRGHRVLAGSVIAARTIRRLDEPLSAPAGIKPLPPGNYPTGRSQEGLWTWLQMNPAATRTTVVHAIRLEGPIDPARMELAINAVVRCHEALRTTFELNSDQQLEQRIAPPSHWSLATVPICSPIEIEQELRDWLEHRFDVCECPWTARLLVGQGFGALVFAADHLVFDGESANLLQRDLARSYDDLNSLHNGVPGPASLGSLLRPAPRRVQDLRDWWCHALEGFADQAVLPEPLCGGPPDMRLRRLDTPIEDALWEGITEMARSAGTTAFVVILAALKSFLRARSGSSDNSVAIALSRRHSLDCANAIGNFVNLIPIRDRLDKPRTASLAFSEYLAQTSQNFTAAIEHGDLPFEEIISAAAMKAPASGVATPARIVLVQRIPTEAYVTGSNLRFDAWPDQPMNAIHDLAVFLAARVGHGTARLEWVWPRGTTLDQSPEWMSDAFVGFLAAAVASPATTLGALPMLGPQEVELVALTAKPQPRLPGSEHSSLLSLFDAQVSLRPNAVAVEDAACRITYAQLSERAAAIASAIIATGERKPVVIVLEKSVDQLAAIVATLRTGSPYLPLAPDHARTRLFDLAARALARICIAESSHAESIQVPSHCRLVFVDALESAACEAVTAPDNSRQGPEDIAYVMPTSGSTGVPKLVGVPHRAVVRLVHRSSSLPLDDSDCTMLISNSSFDASTFEIWGALANGGRVVVPTREELREPELLAAAIERHGVTAGFFTTTFFERLLINIHRLAKMRHVVVGGEVVPPRLFAAAAAVISGSVLVNGYGPTENTTFSCSFRLDGDPLERRTVPIGRPISGSGAMVVDESLHPVPPGTSGEILVTGEGLAVGYLDDPDLTRERFVTVEGAYGGRAYRTGDLGRLLPDGLLEYLGRIDRQIKVRGFRIEPGEVEAVLADHPAVRRSVVYADTLGAVRTLLAAAEAPDSEEQELRRWISERLPDYLVPTRIYVVDRLPMTDNGKLNHVALRETRGSESRSFNVPPRTELECIVGKIMAQILGLESISADEDFFSLGANSLLVLALTARLREHLGRPVPNHLVYSAPTSRSLARKIEAAAAPSTAQAAQVVRDRATRIWRASN